MYFTKIVFVISVFTLCYCAKQLEIVSNKEYASLPTLFHLDNYDDCMLLEEDALYCSFTYELHHGSKSNNSKLWRILEIVTSNPYNYRHDHLRHGICVPKTCPKVKKKEDNNLVYTELENCYNEKFKHLGVVGNITNLRCEGRESIYPIDWIDWTAGLLFVAYFGFILFASFITMYYNSRKNTEPRWLKTCSAFSIPRNWKNLKTINHTSDIERLRCIQGVRFYNTVIVILAHTVMLYVMAHISNPRELETGTERIATVFLTSAPFCVSVFFMISSWLLIYGVLVRYDDQKNIEFKTLIIMFFRRCIRLTPTLGVIILFVSTWMRHLGNGPNWNHIIGREHLQCRKNWWVNLFYVNNFVDSENMCLLVTWYLALDTQYFGLLLLIIWFIKKWSRGVWIILGGLLSFNATVTFLKNYSYGYQALMIPKPELLYDMKNILKNQQWHVQYTGFSENLSGPLIGLCIGFLYFKHKEHSVFTKKIHIWIWWIIFIVLPLGLIMLTGKFAFSKNVQNNITWASLHVATSRLIFSFGIGFGLFGVTQGLGNVLKWMLEWPPLYVLGRLTYSAYLVHMPILLIRTGMKRSPAYMNDFVMFMELLGNLTLTYIIATVVTLFFEMPVCELLKLSSVFQQKNTDKNKES